MGAGKWGRAVPHPYPFSPPNPPQGQEEEEEEAAVAASLIEGSTAFFL